MEKGVGLPQVAAGLRIDLIAHKGECLGCSMLIQVHKELAGLVA